MTTSRRTLLKGAVAAGVGVAAYSSPIVSSVPVYATHGLSSFSSQSDVLCIWFSPNHQKVQVGKETYLWGDWHPGFSSTAVYDPNGNTFKDAVALKSSDSWNTPFEVKYRVGTTGGTNKDGWRSVEWGGHPNNITYTNQDVSNEDQKVGEYPAAAAIIDVPGDGYHGGGIKIKLLDPKCEFLVLGIKNAGGDSKVGEQKYTPDLAGCLDYTTVTDNSTSWANGNSSEAITPSATPNGLIPNPWQGDKDRTVYYHTGQERKEDGSPWSMFFQIRCND